MRLVPMLAAGVAALAATLPAGGLAAASATAPTAGAPPAAGSPPTCAGRAPRDLRLTRISGPRARLTWKAPPSSAGSGVAYRVRRSGRTVGQATRGSIVLRVMPGRLTTFSVQARSGLDGGHGCWSKARSKAPFRGPGRVSGVKILRRASGKVTLAWRTAARGDAPLAGYRVVRDAVVVGQTDARSYVLTVSGGRAHRVSVAAVDTRGRLGQASKALEISAGGLGGAGPSGAPSTPAGVSASEVSERGRHDLVGRQQSWELTDRGLPRVPRRSARRGTRRAARCGSRPWPTRTPTRSQWARSTRAITRARAAPSLLT